MPKKSLMLLNPFRVMGYDSEDIIPAGGLGAVAAHAGVGKTALLVQMSLNAMLRGKRVLHISLQDPVTKVNLWYQELFNDLAEQAGLKDAKTTWEEILPHRFIMTFKVEGFNVPKLKERLTDLLVQNIFVPEIIIIDGMKFDVEPRETITALRDMAREQALRIWFTVHVHRHEERVIEGMPAGLVALADLFEVVFTLQPEGGRIRVKPWGTKANHSQPLFLDPATMLVKPQARELRDTAPQPIEK